MAWLLVSTVVLNQPLMDGWINRKPERVHVGWDFAVSLFPGHAMAWGVTLRGHSRRQAWAIHVQRASVWFVPWALLDREIHLSGLRARGAAVHLKPGRVQLPGPLAKPHPFTLRLSDIRAKDITSVVMEGALAATGSASASLDLRKVLAGGEIEIANGQLDWQRLKLVAGPATPVRGGRLSGRFALAGMVPAQTTTAQKIQAVTADLQLDLELPPLALDDTGMRVDKQAATPGRLEGRLVVTKGRVDDLSQLALNQPLAVTADGLEQQRAISAGLRLRDERIVLTASMPAGKQQGTVLDVDLSLPRSAAEGLAASAQNGGDSAAGGVIAGLGGITGNVDLRLRFESLSLLRPWLARWKGLEASGKGWLEARVRLQDGHVMPESQLAFDGAQLRLAALGHQLDARVDGELQRVDDKLRHRRLTLQSLQMRGPDGALLLADADAVLELTQARPDATLLDAPILTLRMDEVAIPDLQVINHYFPAKAITFGEGRATLGFWLTIEPDAAHAQGQLSLVSPAARISLADREMRGSVAVRATLKDADLATRALLVKDLHVDLGRLSYRQAGGPAVSNGWLRVHVPQARAVIGVPIHLDGEARLAMADLRLLLELYAQRSDMPRWLLRLADKGQVDATGRFRLTDGALSLENVRIKNERYTVNADLRLAKGGKRGRLLVEWGRLALGVGMADEKNKIHLRGARAWYQGHSR